MNKQQAINLLNIIKDRFSQIYIVIPIPDGPSPEDVEEVVQSFIESGYACFVQSVAGGDQIVITDKRNEDT